MPLKRHSQWKTEKVNSTTEFYIFKLVLIPNFSLNWLFWFTGLNLSQKGISSLNQKKWTAPLNSAYSNQSTYQISVKTDNFKIFDQICPTKYFWSKTEKVNITNEFCIFELVPVTNFSLMIFWTESSQNTYFRSKTQKIYPTIECSAYLNLGTKFQL